MILPEATQKSLTALWDALDAAEVEMKNAAIPAEMREEFERAHFVIAGFLLRYLAPEPGPSDD